MRPPLANPFPPRPRTGTRRAKAATGAFRATRAFGYAPPVPSRPADRPTESPWRLDPGFSHRIPEATDFDRRIILFCRHGYSSSLAAWNLRQMGLHRATDIVGGFDAWEAAGLPVHHGPVYVRP